MLQIQVFGALQNRFHAKLIGFLVALNPWRTNGRTFGPVKHAKLNSSSVCVQPHRAAHGINLTDNVTLRQTSDRRVARHLANRIQILSQHEGPASDAGGRQCRLNSRMAASDHHYVVFFQPLHFDLCTNSLIMNDLRG